ncbi:MAG: hypothetical protein K0S74_1422 [Chlamydiales bacterium]|jgi:tetrahydromethanopterin S-methyltransferase subunit B|nr:hypothetical protein [Chlamydiales bacterium]
MNFISSMANSITNSATTTLSYIPVANRLVRSRREDLENQAGRVATIAQESLNSLNAPVTGSLGSRSIAWGACGSIGGCVGGIVIGAVLAALSCVVLWGTGAGLWVEGEKNNNEGLILAGRILVLYVSIPLIALTSAVTCCYGGVAGGMGGVSLAD